MAVDMSLGVLQSVGHRRRCRRLRKHDEIDVAVHVAVSAVVAMFGGRDNTRLFSLLIFTTVAVGGQVAHELVAHDVQ